MTARWKQFRRGALLVSCCMLALGILMLIWPEISALAVCIILGILCTVAGVYELVRYFKLGLAGVFFRFDLTFGICSILIGVLLLVHPYGAITFLPIAAGFYMIIGSVLDIQVAVEMRRFRLGSWGLSLALGIVSILLALFLLINPFAGAKALMILIGAALILGSIQTFYSIHCISKAVKASRNDQIIDLE